MGGFLLASAIFTAALVSPRHSSTVATLAAEVVRSTEMEWSESFRAGGLKYRALRFVIIETPRGHPAGGSGYSGSIMALDARELDDRHRVRWPQGRPDRIKRISRARPRSGSRPAAREFVIGRVRRAA